MDGEEQVKAFREWSLSPEGRAVAQSVGGSPIPFQMAFGAGVAAAMQWRLGHFRKAGIAGGAARTKALSPQRRKQIARKAAAARWGRSKSPKGAGT